MKIKRGFTLIELMVVMVVIGVLCSILLPNLVRARISAKHSSCVTNIKNIATGLESYKIDHKYYPTLEKYHNDFYGSDSKYISALPYCPSLGKVDGQYEYSLTLLNGEDYLLHCKTGLSAHTALYPDDDGYPRHTASGLEIHKH